ncbi:MAG: addiction module antitoxin [Planctomycetota bacterium]
MHRKLTITLDEVVYEGLHRVVGRGSISQFIETLVRPHVTDADLNAEYCEMAADEAREAEAHAWVESTLEDAYDATR